MLLLAESVEGQTQLLLAEVDLLLGLERLQVGPGSQEGGDGGDAEEDSTGIAAADGGAEVVG